MYSIEREERGWESGKVAQERLGELELSWRGGREEMKATGVRGIVRMRARC